MWAELDRGLIEAMAEPQMKLIPPTGPLVHAARALATLMKRPGRVSQLAPVSLTSDPVVLDAAHIHRYATLCGFTCVDQVPMTYPQLDRKSTRLNSSHIPLSRMPSSA